MSDERGLELNLIRKCQLGESGAFDALYVRHGARVWRICARMAKDPTEAEDLAQEVWLTVFRKIADFRCEAAFSTWLYRITVNVCLQQYRGVMLQELTDETLPDPRPSPEEVCTANENSARITAALADLPETLRLALLLRVEEGLPYAEIASILDCTTAAVKMRIARARAILAGVIAEETK
jgi:RNA polymerase sigma-70 factor, ECF subfamily